ncbi:MAG TPA: extracellular solute-binding protein, partial [Gemmatimonadaceae bacterium]|nr:extracellular solute-binding protein [Gemmatimonadaceae bacterium]
MRFNNGFRRSFVAMAAIGGMATLSACGGGTSKPAVDGKVTDITVVTGKNPWSDGIKSHLAEYKKLTGVTVKLETYGNEQLNDQYKVKLNASASDFDVMAFQVQDVMREFSRNGWLTDMTKYVGSAGDWNWNDFQKSARDSVTLDKVIYGVPLMTERHVMYYRKDLLNAAGIAVPKTLDELKAAAAKLHNPAKKMTGIAMRGQRVPAVTQFSSFLYSFGGDFQKNDTATIDTPEAIA